MDDKMTITFLGTGTSQGIPVIGSNHPVCLSKDPKDKRLRVSVLISWKNYNYVIDCGPDFRQQMLTNPIGKLDGILFTHEHAAPFSLDKGIFQSMPILGLMILYASVSTIFLLMKTVIPVLLP